MEIGIGNADVPGNKAMRSDLDLVLGHDERAVEQSEIADGAAPIHADGKGATGINRIMVAEDERAGLLVAQEPKHLRGLAIESLAEFHIGRNRLGPPIAFHMSILPGVAQDRKSTRL